MASPIGSSAPKFVRRPRDAGAKSLFSLRPTPARKDDDDNDEASMHRALDPCRYLLSLAMTAPAGQGFFYNTGALTLVSALSERPPGALAPTYGRAETSIQWCDYSITSKRIRMTFAPEGLCFFSRVRSALMQIGWAMQRLLLRFVVVVDGVLRFSGTVPKMGFI
jgi:hypothetical protein